MKHLLTLALFVTSCGVLAAQERRDPPPRPPGTDPTQPPGGFPGGPPGGFPGQPPGGFPGQPPGGFPGFPGGTDYKELVGVLVDMLEDSDADVRQSVVTALAKIGRQAVDPLTDIVKDKDKSASLRANAAYILGQIGPQARTALPVLTKALKENDKELKKRAAFAVANIVGDEFNIGGLPPGIFGPGGMGGGVGIGVGGKAGGPMKIHDPGVVPPTPPKEKKPEKEEK